MFTEADEGKGIWTNRINSHWLLHSIPRTLKYHETFGESQTGTFTAGTKVHLDGFYFPTQAQVFRREEDLICWWGSPPSNIFRESLSVPLRLLAVCSLVSVPHGFISGLSSTMKVRSKNVRYYIQQLLKIVSWDQRKCKDAWIQIPPRPSYMKQREASVWPLFWRQDLVCLWDLSLFYSKLQTEVFIIIAWAWSVCCFCCFFVIWAHG